MDLMTALAIVGGVATVCLTLLKIYSMRKASQEPKTCPDLEATKQKMDTALASCEDLKSRIAVLEAQREDLRGDVERIDEHCDKLHDLLVKLLTDDR